MKVFSVEQKTVFTAWTVAFLFNAIFGTVLVLAFGSRKLSQLKPIDLPAISFVIIGLALLIWAIRETILWKTYGQTCFLSKAESVSRGGYLNGSISFLQSPPASLGRSFRVTLRCVAEDTGAGGKGRTRLVWSDSHLTDIASDRSIPVTFDIPKKIETQQFIGIYQRTFWELKVKQADSSFFAFHAKYILPIDDRALDNDPFEEDR